MVKRRILNPSFEAGMADLLRRLDESAHQSATVPHGVKVMGPGGDTVWVRPDGTVRPVREVDTTVEVNAEFAEKLGDEIAAERARMAEAEELLDSLDTRVDDVDAEGAARVSAGPVPPSGAPIGAQWITPEGWLYVRIPCEEVP